MAFPRDDTSRPGTKYNDDLTAAAAALGLDPSKLAALGAGGTSGVYLPEEPGSRAPFREPRPGEREGHLTWSSVPVKIPEEEAGLVPYRWSEAQRQRFWDRMVASGQVSPQEPYNFDRLLETWQKFVKRSLEATAATGKDTSPWDVIGLYAGGAGAKSKARTVKTTNVHLTTGEAARSVLHRMMQGWLGRDASEEEVDNFHASLNSAEKRNPSISTTRYDASGTPTSQTTTGGLDAGAFTEQYAKGGHWSREHALVQAAGPMFNALLDAIKSPV